MIQGKTIACVIPARLQSSRFPRKILQKLLDKPILQWVYESALSCEIFDLVVFAVDDEETATLVHSFGGTAVMTDLSCPSGTMRLVDFRKKHGKDFDLWLNWQGDEPLITKEMIYDLFKGDFDTADVITLMKKITNDEASSPGCTKVVTDKEGHALYFSRSLIPFIRDENTLSEPYFKHIGLYVYTQKALDSISSYTVSPLEHLEKLEQLTFLYNGLKIKVLETKCEAIGIDYPDDLNRAQDYLARKQQLILT